MLSPQGASQQNSNHTQLVIGRIDGVIQGSCIGSMLIVLYINDAVNIFNNAIESKLNADDLTLYS